MNLVLTISHSDNGATINQYQHEVDYKEMEDSIDIVDKSSNPCVCFSGKIKHTFPEKNNYDLLDENNTSYKLFKSKSSIKLIRMDNSYDGKPYVWIIDK